MDNDLLGRLPPLPYQPQQSKRVPEKLVIPLTTRTYKPAVVSSPKKTSSSTAAIRRQTLDPKPTTASRIAVPVVSMKSKIPSATDSRVGQVGLATAMGRTLEKSPTSRFASSPASKLPVLTSGTKRSVGTSSAGSTMASKLLSRFTDKTRVVRKRRSCKRVYKLKSSQ